MQVAFHADPANIGAICADLQMYDAVFVYTTRTNFRTITDAVEANGTRVLPLAAKGPDGDFHNFLLRFEGSDYEVNVTEARVMKAIRAWHATGCPIPHVERA